LHFASVSDLVVLQVQYIVCNLKQMLGPCWCSWLHVFGGIKKIPLFYMANAIRYNLWDEKMLNSVNMLIGCTCCLSRVLLYLYIFLNSLSLLHVINNLSNINVDGYCYVYHDYVLKILFISMMVVPSRSTLCLLWSCVTH
jgi:hypothetical protein